MKNKKTILLISLLLLALFLLNFIFFTKYYSEPITTEFKISEVEGDSSSLKLSLFVKSNEDFEEINGGVELPEGFEIIEGEKNWEFALNKNQEKEFIWTVKPSPTPPTYGFESSQTHFTFNTGEYSQKVSYKGEIRFSEFSEGIQDPITSEELLDEYRKNIQNPEWVNERYTVCDGDYCFVPEPRKGEDSQEYFKSLDIKEDEVYVMIQFEISEENLGYGPSESEKELLSDQKIDLVKPYGAAQIAKVPLNFLENGPKQNLIGRFLNDGKKDFNFIRWIGVFTPERKIDSSLKYLLKEDQNSVVKIVVSSYENLDNGQVNILKSFSKESFSGKNQIFSMNCYSKDIIKISELNFIKKVEVSSTPAVN